MAELIADPFRAARLLLSLRQEGVTDPSVLAAMETIGRAAFVDDAGLEALSFEDSIIPIPCGQVMLRPSATGHLIQAMGLKRGQEGRVLLIGFGSGYMAALLSQLAAHVFAVERFARLTEEGRVRLARLGVENVTLSHRDGLHGWAEQGPFDAIVLAGAVPAVPEGLTAQLTRGGVLVAPINEGAGQANLLRVTASGSELDRRPLFQWVPPLIEGRAQVL
ncbi:protein-L-isoaspartate(D-aspartate) O-methyltransferase [Hyphomonas neptunium ATCC 15444]|uniref:Protein-L-isoaspartate O-methyltransferase n=2 Tax=Hyphomonas TaxID=85 RepID=Q0C0W4_HYPNA|nr:MULTISPECIES: methyltransferase domain-containing protein [Hyphomonas]ABI78433.1 protein-L-isoaspartate(D-aspartate) O-methyltransferase [Hyphomonas neptunium ATCC 15444]KCZ94956.1 protein-L-isoaspartate(D-aspartate) O-methyltransferase [Hyphomonas hirschiana VP5]